MTNGVPSQQRQTSASPVVSAGPTQQDEVDHQETLMGIGESSVSPPQPGPISTPPHSEKEVANQETQMGIGDSSVSPAQQEQISTPRWSDSELNITVITVDPVVQDTSSKSTLPSDMSSSETDEEIATGMVDPIITVIEPISDPPSEIPPETPRCKFIFFDKNCGHKIMLTRD